MRHQFIACTIAFILQTHLAIAGSYNVEGAYVGQPDVRVAAALANLHGSELEKQITALLNTDANLLGDIIHLATTVTQSDRDEVVIAVNAFVKSLLNAMALGGSTPSPGILAALSSNDAKTDGIQTGTASIGINNGGGQSNYAGFTSGSLGGSSGLSGGSVSP